MQFYLVEDHTLVRRLLSRYLEEFGWKLVGESDNAEQALVDCLSLAPDFVLADVVLPGEKDGLELGRLLKNRLPRVKVIAFSATQEPYTLYRVLAAGVDGYVDKSREDPSLFAEAVKSVQNGKPYFAEVVGRVRAELSRDPMAFYKVLTAREEELMPLLGSGLTNEEVASLVGITPTSVQGHRRRIMSKLNLNRTPELMNWARKVGFWRK